MTRKQKAVAAVKAAATAALLLILAYYAIETIALRFGLIT